MASVLIAYHSRTGNVKKLLDDSVDVHGELAGKMELR